MQNLTKLEISGKRKKIMDKYFAPRTTQGARPSIKSALARKEAIFGQKIWLLEYYLNAFLLML